MTSVVAVEAAQVAVGDAEAEQLAGLVAGARTGDRAALERLLETIERRVYVLAYRLVGDPVAAEDVSQEVFLKICRRLDQYRGGSFLGWVYRMVVNQAHDYRRTAGPRTEEIGDDVATAGYDADREEQLQRVGAAMQTITEKERTALVLTEIEGFSSAEAARIAGCLRVTLRVRAAQARRKIRRALSRYYPELREAK